MIFLEKVKLYIPGIFVCAAIALGCTFLGLAFPLIGGPVFGILAGMAIALVWKRRDRTSQGITFTSKKILQYAVILLGMKNPLVLEYLEKAKQKFRKTS